MWHLKNNALYDWKNVLGEPVQRAKGVTIGKASSRVLILAVGFHLGSWFAYFALGRFSQEPIWISKKSFISLLSTEWCCTVCFAGNSAKEITTKTKSVKKKLLFT